MIIVDHHLHLCGLLLCPASGPSHSTHDYNVCCVTATDLLWISTYTFVASYLPQSADSTSQPSVVLTVSSVSTPTEGDHRSTIHLYLEQVKNSD